MALGARTRRHGSALPTHAARRGLAGYAGGPSRYAASVRLVGPCRRVLLLPTPCSWPEPATTRDGRSSPRVLVRDARLLRACPLAVVEATAIVAAIIRDLGVAGLAGIARHRGAHPTPFGVAAARVAVVHLGLAGFALAAGLLCASPHPIGAAGATVAAVRGELSFAGFAG